jgi:putative glutamine amidotransferase
MPGVGICRGHQILNVYLGGSLIVDIPQDIGTRVTHQCEDYLRCFHRVNVAGGRRLAGISGCDTATVTTNHHQAVDRLAPSLMANATSGDHLIEGIEWKEPAGKSFLMGVQWHPERMEPANPLSGPLVREFLLQSARYSVINKR